MSALQKFKKENQDLKAENEKLRDQIAKLKMERRDSEPEELLVALLVASEKGRECFFDVRANALVIRRELNLLMSNQTFLDALQTKYKFLFPIN